jgi:fluoride ion exporter CrcB/FEX
MPGLKQLIIVALGGAVGSVLRYKLGGFALHHTDDRPVLAASSLGINEQIDFFGQRI